MSVEPTTDLTKRPDLRVRFLVEDSGRTWLVTHDQIPAIPPDSIEVGDVLVLEIEDEPGVMFVQAVQRNDRGAWDLSVLEREEGDGAA